MTDLSQTIAPKSDQLNADDLIGRTMTIKITKVTGVAGDQPIAIYFEGDNGKPYKPCKSMRRVLVQVWGKDGNAYAGRSMTLYRDDKVTFGGIAVGGIRISHMSDITQNVTMALTSSKARRSPYTVKPLRTAPDPELPSLLKAGGEAAAQGTAPYIAWRDALSPAQKDKIRPHNREWSRIAKEADDAKPQADACVSCSGAGVITETDGFEEWKKPCPECSEDTGASIPVHGAPLESANG